VFEDVDGRGEKVREGLCCEQPHEKDDGSEMWARGKQKVRTIEGRREGDEECVEKGREFE